MKIGIVIPGGKRLNTEADPDMFPDEIVQQLIAETLIPAGPYVVSFKDKLNHRQLNPDQTLAQNGVDENDNLNVLPGDIQA